MQPSLTFGYIRTFKISYTDLFDISTIIFYFALYNHLKMRYDDSVINFCYLLS